MRRLVHSKGLDAREHIQKVHRHQLLSNSERVDVLSKENSMVENTLTEVLKTRPLVSKHMLEIKQFHRWICVWFHYSRSFPRLMRVVALASNVIVTLFLQALVYNVTNPNDGSCKLHVKANNCLAEMSAFQDGESKCYWLPGERFGTCHFREPANNLKVIVTRILDSCTLAGSCFFFFQRAKSVYTNAHSTTP